MKERMAYLMIFFRTLSHVVVQSIIAITFYFLGKNNAWNIAEGWWFVSGFSTNILTLFLLIKLNRNDGRNFFDVLRFNRKSWWKDLIIAVGTILIIIPIFFISGEFIQETLFGAEVAEKLLIRPIPKSVIYIGIFWALTQGLVELPTYWTYSYPKLAKKFNSSTKAWIICSIAITIQHIAVPLILDYNYILWRLGSYIFMSLGIGFVIIKRPKSTPYFMIIQSLMDCMFVIGILNK